VIYNSNSSSQNKTTHVLHWTPCVVTEKNQVNRNTDQMHASVLAPSTVIAHDPQMPSRHDRRNVSVGSISFLILMSASRTIGPQSFRSTSYDCMWGLSPGWSGFYQWHNKHPNIHKQKTKQVQGGILQHKDLPIPTAILWYIKKYYHGFSCFHHSKNPKIRISNDSASFKRPTEKYQWSAFVKWTSTTRTYHSD